MTTKNNLEAVVINEHPAERSELDLVDVGAKLQEKLHRLRQEEAELEKDVQRQLDALNLGEQLRNWRDANGIRQSDVARLASLNQSQISKIEAGKIDTLEFRTLVRALTAVGARLEVRFDSTASEKQPAESGPQLAEPKERDSHSREAS